MPDIGQDAKYAARLLKEGKLVAMPTETVYGLAADAANGKALERLFEAKGRPKSHPVIVHIASAEQLKDWVLNVPPLAEQLAERFWPGPLTLILPKQPHVLMQVTGGQQTVAIRVPEHPLALELLREFGGGLAAPSANRFGKLSPTRAQDVQAEFGDAVSYILDGGPCRVGIESTILDLSSDHPRILRPGMISGEDLKPYIDINTETSPAVHVHQADALGTRGHKEAASHDQGRVHSVTGTAKQALEVRAPGTLKSHYSPQTPLLLVDGRQLIKRLDDLSQKSMRVGVLSFRPQVDLGAEQRPFLVKWLVGDENPRRYARSLYANLRELDACRCDWIVVERPPETDNWGGVRDRLNRASYKDSTEAP